jgi:hypothetical protein
MKLLTKLIQYKYRDQVFDDDEIDYLLSLVRADSQ